VFGRKKRTANEIAAAEAAELAQQQQDNSAKLPEKKGTPTPKRRDQEAARRRPLVPSDRKAARAAQRQHIQQERVKMRRAMETGDERHLPPRDRGDQRRFARNWVDARTGIGEWMLIVVLAFLFVSLAVPEQLRLVMSQFLWIILILVIVESWWVGRSIRKRLDQKYGIENRERGVRLYAAMRSLQIRRLRLPKPQVKRGQFPS
jgi:hypothetical protein